MMLFQFPKRLMVCPIVVLFFSLSYASPDNSFKIVAYYPSWAFKKTQYDVEKIPAHLLDYLIYAFAIPTEDGKCIPLSEENDKININSLRKLKQKNPHIKILVAIGGWGYSKPFSQICKNTSLREKFVASAINYMEQNYFDGIDLDWEYPTEKEQKDFIAFIKLFRKKLNELSSQRKRFFLFTIATPAGPWHVERMSLAEAVKYVDWINVMTYDYAGSWNEVASHNAPLFLSSNAPNSLCVHNTVEAYLKAGINPRKLVLGIPFFGHGWFVKDGDNNGLFHKVVSPMKGIGGRGTLDYKEIVSYFETAIRYWDASARVPWLYDKRKQIMISYDDPESIRHKINYAIRQKLGGVMIWNIAADSEQCVLIKAVHESVVDYKK